MSDSDTHIRQATTGPHDGRLSLILVCYNMARELPRTIETLSARMQIGLTEDDYELIVVDNGSSHPVDRQACLTLASNCRFLDTPEPTASPGKAIAFGVDHARFDNLGILIDGARMASPGLIRDAREALRSNEHAVVGTLGFHLGPKVQMKSVLEGYDQAAEDRLLETVDWRRDGYRLFEIACLAGSSARGWFQLPSETNALFIRRSDYERLGGYDTRFASPGGGLINHDFWNRVCEDNQSALLMLLGEATFHQFHGGVATNATQSPWDAFVEEYEKITCRPYIRANKPFKVYGTPRFLTVGGA